MAGKTSKTSKPVAEKSANKPECEQCQHVSYCDKAKDLAVKCKLVKNAEKKLRAQKEAAKAAEKAAHEAAKAAASAQAIDAPVSERAKKAAAPTAQIELPPEPDKGVAKAQAIGFIKSNPSIFFSQYKEGPNGVTIQPHSSHKAIVFKSWMDALKYIRTELKAAKATVTIKAPTQEPMSIAAHRVASLGKQATIRTDAVISKLRARKA